MLDMEQASARDLSTDSLSILRILLDAHPLFVGLWTNRWPDRGCDPPAAPMSRERR